MRLSGSRSGRLSAAIARRSHHHRRRRRGKAAICSLALLCVAAGCGGGPPPKLAEHSNQTARAAPLGAGRPVVVREPSNPPTRCVAATSAIGSSRFAYAAVVKRLAVAYRATNGTHMVGRFGKLDINGLPTVLGVIGMATDAGCKPAWYRVRLPLLPNGSTGWVPAGTIRLYRVTSRIVVSLSQRRLRLYRSGKLALETRVGIGASATPTPTGRFYVNERYVLSSADGPFGPNALGISAHSEALEHVWVENGPIAIHGTNEPWSIGQAASHGCIRLANDVMRRLFALAPAGTPVVVER